MIDKKTLKKSIAIPFEKAGFIKRGQSWYLDGKDVIVMTSLQKSDWGNLYYINIGIWLKALGNSSFPNENQCHIGFRAESLFPEKRELLFLSCSLDKSTPEMLPELSEFIERELVPFLRICVDLDQFSKLVSNGILKKGLVTKEARQYLSSKY